MAGNAGKIISEIKKAGFEVSALQMFNMERANAEEFYEIYKGVLQEYKGWLCKLCCTIIYFKAFERARDSTPYYYCTQFSN